MLERNYVKELRSLSAQEQDNFPKTEQEQIWCQRRSWFGKWTGSGWGWGLQKIKEPNQFAQMYPYGWSIWAVASDVVDCTSLKLVSLLVIWLKAELLLVDWLAFLCLLSPPCWIMLLSGREDVHLQWGGAALCVRLVPMMANIPGWSFGTHQSALFL